MLAIFTVYGNDLFFRKFGRLEHSRDAGGKLLTKPENAADLHAQIDQAERNADACLFAVWLFNGDV